MKEKMLKTGLLRSSLNLPFLLHTIAAETVCSREHLQDCCVTDVCGCPTYICNCTCLL